MQLDSKDVKEPLKDMTIEWLADKCNVSVNLLSKLARDTSVMFWPTRKEPKKGRDGYREIDPPKKEYKKILKGITKAISSKIKHHPAAHGGIPKRSSFTSAKQHCGAKFLITRDIKDCYPSITTQKLFNAFKKLGSSCGFSKFLSLIMTVHGRIPQGGPTSCLALNLYMLRMDDHLYTRTKEKGGHYSRLADDFVISADTREKALKLEWELDHAIRHRKLKVNEGKRRKKGFLGGESRKEIHSLVVNSNRGLKPKKEHLDKGLRLAEHYARCCRCAKPTDLPFLADLRQRAYGMMYYLRQADFSPSKQIRRMLEKADEKVLIMLRQNGLYAYKNKWWIVHKTRNEPLRLLNTWEGEKNLAQSA